MEIIIMDNLYEKEIKWNELVSKSRCFSFFHLLYIVLELPEKHIQWLYISQSNIYFQCTVHSWCLGSKGPYCDISDSWMIVAYAFITQEMIFTLYMYFFLFLTQIAFTNAFWINVISFLEGTWNCDKWKYLGVQTQVKL